MTHAQAIADMWEELYVVEGFTVTYKRGAQTFNELRAVKGRQEQDRLGIVEQALYLTDQGNDFVVKVEDFKAVTGLNEPERLDKIEWDGKTYTVGVDGSESVYRDPHDLGVLFRVHTQRQQ